MRLHSYRDESRSRHFDLIGGSRRRWSIDLGELAEHHGCGKLLER